MSKEEAKMEKKYAYANSVEAYKIKSLISTSPDATVYLARSLYSERVAIKSIKCVGDVMLPDLDPSLTHPNLLPHIGIFLTDDHCVWAVTPFCSGGSLRTIIPFLSAKVLSEPCVAAVLKPVLSAVAYLHGKRMFHGDIKPGNIIVGLESSTIEPKSIISGSESSVVIHPESVVITPKSPVIMLADLGVSESFYSSETDNENDDRLYWRKFPVNGPASDLWEFGVTAMELVHGGPPLSPECLAGVSESLRFGIRKRFGWSIECEELYTNKAVELENSFSEDLRDMVASCLDPNPFKRPSAADLLRHRFFAENKDFDSLIRKNLLDEIPGVEKRLNEFNIGPLEKARASVSRGRRIVSWEFDKEKFKLLPVYEIGVEPDRKTGFDEVLRTAREAMQSAYKRCKLW